VELSTFAIPFLIFSAEVSALTVSTLRIIFVARGHKFLAPVLGFFEIMIWLVAIGETMRNLDNWACIFAFALGFTLGNYFGILIDQWLALGTSVVRVITHRDPTALVAQLRAAQFGVTQVEGRGTTGTVQIVMTVVKRKQLQEVTELIETTQPDAFYAVHDLRTASDGIFPQSNERTSVIAAPLAKIMGLMVPEKQRKLAGQRDGETERRADEAQEPQAASLH
jgi:uncharacterized protein YebE (UPF0316 family)